MSKSHLSSELNHEAMGLRTKLDFEIENDLMKSNYLEFIRNNEQYIMNIYGRTGEVFRSGKTYQPVVGTTKARCIAEIGDEKEGMKLFAQRLQKSMDKEDVEKDNQIKLFALILMLLSTKALNMVQNHRDHETAKEFNDCAKLMMIIKEIFHTTSPADGKKREVIIDDIRTQRDMLKVRSGQGLDEFYAEYKDACTRLKDAGAPEESEASKAIKFVNSLDKERWKNYHNYIAQMLAEDKDPYPDTLAQALERARKWEVKNGSKSTVAATTETSAACMSQEDIVKLIVNTMKESGKSSGNSKMRSSGAKPAGTCDCGKGEGRHDPKKCWTKHPELKPEKLKARDAQHAADKKRKFEQSGKTSKSTKADDDDSNYTGLLTDEELDAAIEEHMAILTSGVSVGQYPNIKELFSPTVKEVSDQKLMATLASFEAERALHAIETTNDNKPEYSLRGDTTLLLDTGAGRSLVKNKTLVTELLPAAKPVLLRGITGGDSGMHIELEARAIFLTTKKHKASYHANASVNVLSWSALRDDGVSIKHHEEGDYFIVDHKLRFERRWLRDGVQSMHYTCDVAKFLVDQEVTASTHTVADNLRAYTKREVARAIAAKEFQRRLGYASASSAAAVLKGGAKITIDNIPISIDDLKMAENIFGPDVAQLKGSTTQRKAKSTAPVVAPRVVQAPQDLYVDKFEIKEIPFLVGVLAPIGLILCLHLKDESAPTTSAGVQLFISKAKSRGFDVTGVHTDPGGELVATKPDIDMTGSATDIVGPGQHVAVAERAGRTIKERVRGHESSLPYVMCKALLILCVLFCVATLNFQPRQGNVDIISPHEAFSGQKIDSSIHLRFGFGDYCQATHPTTDRSMRARTHGCIMGAPFGNRTGSVTMMSLSTGQFINRDNFKILPTPDHVIEHLNKLAARDGFARGGTIANSRSQSRSEPLDYPTRDRIPVYGRDSLPQHDMERLSANAGVDPNPESVVPPPVHDGIHPRISPRFAHQYRLRDENEGAHSGGVESGGVESGGVESGGVEPENSDHNDLNQASIGGDADALSSHQYNALPDRDLRTSGRSNKGVPATRLGDENFSFKDELLSAYYRDTATGMCTALERDELASQLDAEAIYRHLNHRSEWIDTEFAMQMSVKAALRERGPEAMPVIMKELQQMMDRGVWHPVQYESLSREQKKSIIRSSMFLKDKYLASGAFEKFKARLVAGGDQQDKQLYDNLSSPTVATQLVLTVAAIAAREGRFVETADIPGAFLNADMPETGIKVLVRLDKLMTSILLKIAPDYLPYVTADESLVVQLDKALYGCVESAKLWHDMLAKQLIEYGFKRNDYDQCVFNHGVGDNQMTVAVHVDDLFISCKDQRKIDGFMTHLDELYGTAVARHQGKKLDYVGMTFDFSRDGEVAVTMSNMVDDLLKDCEHIGKRLTPAADNLFDVRDAPKLSDADSKWFHTKTAQALYLAKRARPDCLTAVAFLTTRVQAPDTDDMMKLMRLLGYVNGTRDRGIKLRIGDTMVVRTYIDASYGTHTVSGKSHTGAMVIVGESGVVHARSTKQKTVVKSSTEAELVGLSDALGEALFVANFLRSQGYEVGPVVVYQDNLSCISLVKKGSPCSERSKHIDIRRFWMADRVKTNCIKIEHKGTLKMWANLLTKPLQGAQFVLERQGVTGWE